MKEELQDLISSSGWKIVVAQLEERRQALIREMLTQTEHLSMIKAQQSIRELDYVKKLPHEMLEREAS